MGYLYRRKLNSSPASPLPNGKRCEHEDHGKTDICPECKAHFGKVWWVKYYVNGKPVQESTKATGIRKAEAFLKRHEGNAANGQPILPRVDLIRFEEAAKDLRTYYKTTGRRNLREAE